MKTSFQHGLRAARGALASLAAILLPLLAAADSQLQTGLAGTSLRTTAHVIFKVVIPTVLSLTAPSGALSVRDAQTVAIFSNNHDVMLAATGRSSKETRGTVVLSAAAGKVIAQQVACGPGASRGAALHAVDRHDGLEPDTDGVICTACMP